MDNSFIRTAKIGERIREIRESNPYLTINSRLLDLRANLPLCSAILNEHFDYFVSCNNISSFLLITLITVREVGGMTFTSRLAVTKLSDMKRGRTVQVVLMLSSCSSLNKFIDIVKSACVGVDLHHAYTQRTNGFTELNRV